MYRHWLFWYSFVWNESFHFINYGKNKKVPIYLFISQNNNNIMVSNKKSIRRFAIKAIMFQSGSVRGQFTSESHCFIWAKGLGLSLHSFNILLWQKIWLSYNYLVGYKRLEAYIKLQLLSYQLNCSVCDSTYLHSLGCPCVDTPSQYHESRRRWKTYYVMIDNTIEYKVLKWNFSFYNFLHAKSSSKAAAVTDNIGHLRYLFTFLSLNFHSFAFIITIMSAELPQRAPQRPVLCCLH